MKIKDITQYGRSKSTLDRIKAMDKQLFMHKMQGKYPFSDKKFVGLLLRSFRYKTLYTDEVIKMFKDALIQDGWIYAQGFIGTDTYHLEDDKGRWTDKIQIHKDGTKHIIFYQKSFNATTPIYQIWVYVKTGRVLVI